MVEPPRTRSDVSLWAQASCMASKSKPLWRQKPASSAAITERMRAGDIWSRGRQVREKPFPSSDLWIIRIVTGGGTKR